MKFFNYYSKLLFFYLLLSWCLSSCLGPSGNGVGLVGDENPIDGPKGEIPGPELDLGGDNKNQQVSPQLLSHQVLLAYSSYKEVFETINQETSPGTCERISGRAKTQPLYWLGWDDCRVPMEEFVEVLHCMQAKAYDMKFCDQESETIELPGSPVTVSEPDPTISSSGLDPSVFPKNPDAYWNSNNDQVSKSEVSTPKTNGANLFFDDQDFETIRDNRGQFPGVWNEISGSSDPVAMAIEAKVLGNNSQMKQAFDRINNQLKAEVDEAQRNKTSRRGYYNSTTKNAFGLMYAVYLIYDWSKGFSSISNSDRRAMYDRVKRIFDLARPTVRVGIPATQHGWKLGGHHSTFYMHHDLMGIAFHDIDPEIFSELLREKFDLGRREVFDFYIQSGASPHGFYTWSKMQGYMGSELAWRKLIPAGKSFYHSQVYNIIYEPIFAMQENGNILLDGQMNDNKYQCGTNTNDWRDCSYSFWGASSLLEVAFTLTQDPTILDFYEKNDNLNAYSYDTKVAPHLKNAAVILSAAGRVSTETLPKIKHSFFPMSKTTYRHAHTYTGNTNARNFGMQFIRQEYQGLSHRNFGPGDIQITGRGGFTLLGVTGGFHGSPFATHPRNWSRSGFGKNTLVVLDSSEDWEDDEGRNQFNHGGVRYPYNFDIDPGDFDAIRSPENGFMLARPRGSFADNVMNPKAFVDVVDLAPGYRADNSPHGKFHHRVEAYQRSVATFPLTGESADLDGLVYVVDRFVLPDLNDEYYTRWNFVDMPNTQGRTFVASGIDGDSSLFSYTLAPTDAELIKKSGWEGAGRMQSGMMFMPEMGRGDRIAVYPGTKKRSNLFVQAFLAGKKANSGPSLGEFSVSERDQMITIQFRNKVFVFHQNLNRKDSDFTLSIQDKGYSSYDVLVSNIAAGAWSSNGSSYNAVEGEYAIFFSAPAGTIRFVHP